MRQYIFLVLCMCVGIQVQAQQTTLFGTVRDATSGELLVGASVVDTLSGQGANTNQYGFFSVTVGTVSKVRISYVGYETQWIDAQCTSPLEIRLQPTVFEQVIVREKRSLKIPIGYLPLPIAQIKAIPALLGEVDVLKALALTPGVGSGMDGSAGIYVRGGTPDQTLILLDEVPVYNVTHLLGMFSVFNPNSLKSVELYKGAFPARFGGRLAAVTELTMREGNNQKLQGEVGVGILNQNLTLEGPLIKNKASFIVSGRVSTLGLTEILQSARRKESGEGFKYHFYDLNAKVNFQLSPKDQLYASFYSGQDRMHYEEWRGKNTQNMSTSLMGNEWGNRTASLRYNRIISEKLFGKATLLYTHYASAYENRFEERTPHIQQLLFRKTQASIEDVGAKMQVDYFLRSNSIVRVGADLIQHRFRPFVSHSNYVNESPAVQRTATQAFQADAFLEVETPITSFAQLNAGIRYSSYAIQQEVYRNWEPRLGVQIQLPFQWQINGSYSVMNQYLHLLANSSAGFGFDAWLPATTLATPSQAAQYSLGLSRRWTKPALEVSFEAYQKSMRRLIDYPEGTNFADMLADSWDRMVLTNGSGRAKGMEIMIRKDEGKLKGWLAYTLSKSERRFEVLNENNWFPMKYDRRNMLSLTGSYALNARWLVSSTFVYQTGHAVTLPESAYFLTGNASSHPRYAYGTRHNGRMPDYHRLDVGVSRTHQNKKNQSRTLSMGIYNIYNRANPLYLDFKATHQGAGNQLEVKQYSLFPMLPYITYSFKF